MMTGLRKYREEEARMLAEQSGKNVIGGGTLHNP
jgi:hypothetical protein